MPLILVGVFLAASGVLFTFLKSELVPAEDTGILQASIIAPEGTSFAQMDQYMTEVQARLLPMVGHGAVRSLIIRTPGGFGPSDDFNNGAMSIYLKPWEDRSVTVFDVYLRKGADPYAVKQKITRKLGGQY